METIMKLGIRTFVVGILVALMPIQPVTASVPREIEPRPMTQREIQTVEKQESESAEEEVVGETVHHYHDNSGDAAAVALVVFLLFFLLLAAAASAGA